MLTPGVQLAFHKELDHDYSTGQTQLEHLRNSFSNSRVSIILLDEWDANLDEYNISIINNLIEHYSKDKLIIEVRHR